MTGEYLVFKCDVQYLHDNQCRSVSTGVQRNIDKSLGLYDVSQFSIYL
jgi:hypothetical protein